MSRSYRRRFNNQRGRKNLASGIIMVILVTAGASLGSYAGGAAGFLLSCFVVHFIDNNPNP
jgi:hypothetical protein